MAESTGFGMVPTMPGLLTPYEIAVYVVLSWRTNFETGACFPSHKSIAADACMSEKSVRRALTGLREKGLVEWVQRHDEAGDLTSNVYRIVATRRGGPVSQTEPPVSQTPRSGLTDRTVRSHRPRELEELDQTKMDKNVDDSVAAVSEPERLANLLADLIAANGSKRPTVTPTWVNDIRLMIERDEREPARIEAAIRWCQADPFWSANILSPKALRKQYDRMRLQARRRSQGRDSQQAAVADEAALTGRPVEEVRAQRMADIAATAALARRKA